MKLFVYADKDAFITNTVVQNMFRVEDANTGQAGTLDLFKLHEESTLPGTSSGVQEISKILIHFNLNNIRALTASGQPLSGTAINNAEFRLKLFDVIHGETLPSNFNLIAFPLSKSFDEGTGIDIYAFQDIGAVNFISASGLNSTAVAWQITGAAGLGFLGQTSIDAITGSSTYPGLGNTNLFVSQSFTDGTEDLNINVTTVISGVLFGIIPDYGFIIHFSGTEETDSQTRYIKRFYSRHSNVVSKVPRLEVSFNDSIIDHGQNFIFDTTGSIFMKNIVRGKFQDIISGSFQLTGQATDGKGAAHLQQLVLVKIESGSFSTFVTASHHKQGIYSASFAINSLTTALTGELKVANSATFDITWQSMDRRIPYMSSSLIINEIRREDFVKPKRYLINVTNLKKEYNKNEIAQFRLFVKEKNFSSNASKLPSNEQSSIINEMLYQIRDLETNNILMSFDANSTRISTDRYSNYFDIIMSSFPAGKNYKIEFKIIEDGSEQILDEHVFFRVAA